MTMAKKQPNKTARGRSKAQKATNARKTTTKSTKDKEPRKSKVTIPATIGGDHDTFVTLKRKAAMLKALEHTMGIVGPAAKMVGVHRSTHYNWLKDDAGYADEVDRIIEDSFDFVEGKMLEEINGGNTIMTIFYAKSKMKSRGFVERTEVEVTNKPAFIVSPEAKGVNKVMDVIHKKTGTNDKS